jgi:glutamate-1-semialdehyde 2,1-aminomutase
VGGKIQKPVLVGGVNSPVRAFRRVGADPVVLRSGRGAWVTDAQGRRFLDLIMGWGALILGHNHPEVLRAIRQQLSRGTVLGLTTPLETQLAEAICDAIPSIERVRFTPSGTEACMVAVRVARAWTKRTKVLAFEGCYHGHSDALLPSSAGVPSCVAQETIVVPYNDPDALKETVTRFREEIACAIVEPVAANMGVVVPDGAFLKRLRALATAHGIVLIVDETVTGFRLRYGGIQETLGARPDLTTLGKIIGGGLPIGAVGGRADLMEQLAPNGPVYHAGTFAGHPMAMAAGLATLRLLRREAPYERLEALGTCLADGLRQAAKQARVAVQVNQIGSMLTLFFSEEPVRRFTDAQQADAERFAAWANALRAHGVLVPPSPFEAWFLSTRHTAAHVDRITAIAEREWGRRRVA